MYNLFITAIHELSAITSSIRLSFPTRRKESHIQVHPHSINTFINSVGGIGRVKGAENEDISNTDGATFRTVQNPPTFSIVHLSLSGSSGLLSDYILVVFTLILYRVLKFDTG